jgi:hypothetical protein
MTCPCRMQSYVSKELGKNIISLMHITERVIAGYDIPNTHEKLVNLNPQEREIPERSVLRIKVSSGNVHLWSHEEAPGKWVCHGRPPVRVSRKDTWNIYIATRIITSHI